MNITRIGNAWVITADDAFLSVYYFTAISDVYFYKFYDVPYLVAFKFVTSFYFIQSSVDAVCLFTFVN